MPISRVRSVMETSMIFMTPMPPTSREIPAITEIAMDTVDSISVMEETMLSILLAVTSKLSLER